MGTKEDIEEILERDDASRTRQRPRIQLRRKIAIAVESFERSPVTKVAKREFGLTRAKLRAVPAVRPIPKSMGFQKAEQAKRKWYFSR